MESIIVALITGGLSLIGVVISNISSNKNITKQLEVHQAITETKIDELTKKVEIHNGFAERIPKLEEKIEGLSKRVDRLESK